MVPSRTPVMACTATAIKSDKVDVLENLEMGGYVEVIASPDRPNIYYQVERRSDIESDLDDVLSSLRTNNITAPRVIIYCPSLDVCSEIYACSL